METVEFVAVSLGFVGEGVGNGHEEVELLFRGESYRGKTMVLDKGKRHRTEGLGLADAKGEQKVVMDPRFFGSHGPLAP